MAAAVSTGDDAKPTMRESLVHAAFQLFLDRGFEQTTIDDIVSLAGVGRRSFFRYFPSKEDVVFPDHEGCLVDMTEFLRTAPLDGDPVAQVCDASRLVLRMYAADPLFSVQRYRLTREVPGLRAHELSVVWRYERALAEHLRRRGAEQADGALRADVVAAAVVAAHNHALRTWLRAGGEGDVQAAMDEALGYVARAFSPAGPSAGPSTGVPADGSAGAATATARADGDNGRSDQDEQVVVLLARKGTPLWQVVKDVEGALGQ
ncbi:TetR family transcriptional regulator [Streptacidiphilus neutrinimicus]|uniref:TetR family transcriptional regulator n=1 Tax=Streptacidiphilus neutrinimicus TaxID=105420 RepID=UPI0005A6B32E|nr:TetR family transcriptional regulator [Streptacidiphilus neutrinimicus]